MTKATQMKRLSLAAISAVILTAVVGGSVWAAPCLNPTPDCPQVNCDK